MLSNTQIALVVAGMKVNWAGHFLRSKGVHEFTILVITEWMKTGNDVRISGNVKAIIQILNGMEVLNHG